MRRRSECAKEKQTEEQADPITSGMVITAAFRRGSVLHPVVMNLIQVSIQIVILMNPVI